MDSLKNRALSVAFAVFALLLTSFAAVADPGDRTASSSGQLNVPTRVITSEADGGSAEIVIQGREQRLSDGRCSSVTEVVTLKAEAGVEGLVLDTELTDECRIVVSYFGLPRVQDEVEPEATESTTSAIGETASSDIRSQSVEPGVQILAAGPYVGNYLHSRYRLHDAVEVIIADFWLHNDRRWNGDNVFVCSPGWSGGCFVGGQSQTYKSWNHPGAVQLWYNQGCNATSSCFSVTADGTGNFTTDFFLCNPGSKIALHNTNIAYRTGNYDATYWRTSECNIVGMHGHYAVWSNLTKWDQTP